MPEKYNDLPLFLPLFGSELDVLVRVRAVVEKSVNLDHCLEPGLPPWMQENGITESPRLPHFFIIYELVRLLESRFQGIPEKLLSSNEN